ncbi:hypothetical protein OOT00_02480 [Desulfobotulus sp. H1]|uniref:Mechanosensitive ion channel family protein n=1 Tax=Desulfobotulus pelophilus TaxID=2823377 RepID=A0ABT3N5V9_9BACT|nr:hypothetical protein [Desulfobotulus pelophilus]MCW7752845.1 hypothetical protein [Desulfobotulus pelophilus]
MSLPSFRKKFALISLTLLAALFFLVPDISGSPGIHRPFQEEGPPSALDTLNDLRLSMEAMKRDINAKEEEYETAVIEERRQAIRSELRYLMTLKDAYQREFESIATGMEVESTSHEPLKPFRIEEEIMEVLRPLVEGMKQMTSRPRELERLRKDIAFYETNLPRIRHAIAKIENFMEINDNLELHHHLADLMLGWQEREKEALRQIRRLSFQLDQKTDPKEPILISMQKSTVNFVKTRGRNLFLAFSAFIGTFLLLRLAYWKWSHRQKQSPPPFYHRLLQVVFHSTTAIVSISAALLLLYAFGDWMLLSIALLLLIALAWSARNGMAQFWEQGKLILNMGTLREGERVIHRGLPWKVQKLGLQGILINPELEGGMLRIPLKHLVGMQSRPFMETEPWFPCRKNDILLFADGTIAKVILQTPEQVVGELEGGIRKTWPSVEFLSLSPHNLSTKSFCVQAILRLDYRHKADVTGAIPDILRLHMQTGVAKAGFEPCLQRINVELMETGESSLNIRIFTVFSSEAAEDYLALQRLLHQLSIEAGNRFNWTIPFPQLTIHRPQDKIIAACPD